MTNIRLRDRTFRDLIQLLARQAETCAETCVKGALYFNGAERVTAKQFQCFEIRRFGTPLTEHLSEVEQIHVILQNEICKPIHRQRAGMQLTQERMIVDCAPNALGSTP